MVDRDVIDASIRAARSVVHTARLRPRRRGSRRFGYLHIAKTGGTSTNSLLGRLQHDGYPTPTVLGHGWTITDIRRRFPRMQLALVVRDPLERTISAFNSRHEAGPRGLNTWSPAEATAFALFPTVEAFLAACASDDRIERAAARYAMSSVAHMRDGYVHHFGGPEAIEHAVQRVYCVGTTGELDAFHHRMLEPLDIPADLIPRHSTVEHRSPIDTSAVSAGLTPSDRAAIRSFLSAEYAIYERLLKASDER